MADWIESTASSPVGSNRGAHPNDRKGNRSLPWQACTPVSAPSTPAFHPSPDRSLSDTVEMKPCEPAQSSPGWATTKARSTKKKMTTTTTTVLMIISHDHTMQKNPLRHCRCAYSGEKQ
jgi:hypothetical protein